MHNTDRFVTVVSGLPRSGTSMMMQMLEAGGLPAVRDKVRTADDDNPLGYYEFEPVKALPTEKGWLAEARGKAVKIIYKLVYELPADIDFRIVFMQRDVAEVVLSQEKMLMREGLDPQVAQRDALVDLFQSEVMGFRNWVATRRNMSMYVADYAQVVSDPQTQARQIADFLGGGLSVQDMVDAVEPSLYRNRA